MLWAIVAVVVVGAVFGLGALLGCSVAQNLAGDRARRAARDREHVQGRAHRFVADVVLEG